MGGGGGGKIGPGPADLSVCQSRARGAGCGGKQDGAGGGRTGMEGSECAPPTEDGHAVHRRGQFSIFPDRGGLVPLAAGPKVRDQQGVSLYLDGGKQLLSLVGYGKTHIVLYPWHSGDWPFQGWAVSGGWSHFEDPHYFSSVTGLTLIKSFPDYPLLAGFKITMYGEK